MSEKKQLSNEELEKVSGGYSQSKEIDLSDMVVKGLKLDSIYDTEKYINQEIYVKDRHSNYILYQYYAGTLLKSWEYYFDESQPWRSKRMITIRCKYGYKAGKTFTIDLYYGDHTRDTEVWLVDHYNE